MNMPLPCASRLARSALAFAGTAIYVASFAYAGHGCWLTAAAAVGAAAGIAWLGFAALLVTTTAVPLIELADVCLYAMTPGTLMLLFAAALNFVLYALTGFDSVNAHLVALWFVPVHQGWLLIVNGLMAWLFVERMQHLRMHVINAIMLWFVGLDGLFGLIYLLLRTKGAA